MRLPIITLAFLIADMLIVGCSDHESYDGMNIDPEIKSSGNISREHFEPQLVDALNKVGLDRTAIILPKVPYPVSTNGRLGLVNKSLHDPPSMVGISRRLLDIENQGSQFTYTVKLLEVLGLNSLAVEQTVFDPGSMSTLIEQIKMAGKTGTGMTAPPTNWTTESITATALRLLLQEAVLAKTTWEHASGNLSAKVLGSISNDIAATIDYRGNKPDPYRFLDDAYTEAGLHIDITELATGLTRMLTAVEYSLPVLQQQPLLTTGEWHTPLGKVTVAGTGDDTHSGEYLLLIDLGGNDTYLDVAAAVKTGGAAIVLDLGGDDTVKWSHSPGPGAGVLGISLWVDNSGDDHYIGGNLGLGAGILGAGLLWDLHGNDVYNSNAISQGIGQYGVGILIDDQGDDRYQTKLNGQGYGGSGGVGVLVDSDGNDEYFCGGGIPDVVSGRIARHRTTRHLSLCQGYGFGKRPDISGGIGLLLDSRGDDAYEVDIFGQGSAYWFGIGLLVDGTGNDNYKAFEHSQGEGLHLAAGILSDWAGNDNYTGHEHTQGVGKDRAAGILYDASGNDTYNSKYESQGSGLSSYGVGLLIDSAGNDQYKALSDSQGYAGPDPEFPDIEWPTGILLDYGGKDIFDQPYSKKVDAAGRIQNKQGIAIRFGE